MSVCSTDQEDILNYEWLLKNFQAANTSPQTQEVATAPECAMASEREPSDQQSANPSEEASYVVHGIRNPAAPRALASSQSSSVSAAPVYSHPPPLPLEMLAEAAATLIHEQQTEESSISSPVVIQGRRGARQIQASLQSTSTATPSVPVPPAGDAIRRSRRRFSTNYKGNAEDAVDRHTIEQNNERMGMLTAAEQEACSSASSSVPIRGVRGVNAMAALLMSINMEEEEEPSEQGSHRMQKNVHFEDTSRGQRSAAGRSSVAASTAHSSYESGFGSQSQVSSLTLSTGGIDDTLGTWGTWEEHQHSVATTAHSSGVSSDEDDADAAYQLYQLQQDAKGYGSADGGSDYGAQGDETADGGSWYDVSGVNVEDGDDSDDEDYNGSRMFEEGKAFIHQIVHRAPRTKKSTALVVLDPYTPGKLQSLFTKSCVLYTKP